MNEPTRVCTHNLEVLKTRSFSSPVNWDSGGSSDAGSGVRVPDSTHTQAHTGTHPGSLCCFGEFLTPLQLLLSPMSMITAVSDSHSISGGKSGNLKNHFDTSSSLIAFGEAGLLFPSQ